MNQFPERYKTQFIEMDSVLESLGITQENRLVAYRLVAGILNLGNVEFKNFGFNECHITDCSRETMSRAADLLSINQNDLETSLTNRSIIVMGSKVRYAIIIST